MKKSISSLALAAFLTLGISGTALAQTSTTPVPGEPRVNEVNQRLSDQSARVNAGVADGQLNATQAQNLNNRDAHISQAASNAEANQGGHLTAGQTARLNKRLNKNSVRIHNGRTSN